VTGPQEKQALQIIRQLGIARAADRKPRLDYPRLRVARFSGEALT
jgi:hypothetical protein